MMTLIPVAICTAYLYSSAVVFGLTGKMFFRSAGRTPVRMDFDQDRLAGSLVHLKSDLIEGLAKRPRRRGEAATLGSSRLKNCTPAQLAELY